MDRITSAVYHPAVRWHILDPIRFTADLCIEIQQIGHDGRTLFERSDDVSGMPEAPRPFPDPRHSLSERLGSWKRFEYRSLSRVL